jgi:hypothetical protein
MPEQNAIPLRYTAFAVVLLLLYIVGAYQLEVFNQYSTAINKPSTLTHSSQGVMAAYELMKRLNIPSERSSTRWSTLKKNTGCLFSFQPYTRQPDAQELKDLMDWIKSGGTFVLVCDQKAAPADRSDPLAGDVAVISIDNAKPSLCVPRGQSALTKEVGSVAVESSVRLAAYDPRVYTTVFKDDAGAILITRPLGKGRVILVANQLFASNAGIGKADNAVLIYNIAQSSLTASGSEVAFDEYHQGIGFDSDAVGPGRRIIALLPTPIRWCAVLSILLGILLTASSFSRPIAEIERTEAPRAAVDHVKSMARLYKSASACKLAMRPIYMALLHDLRRRLTLTSSQSEEDLLVAAEQSEEFGTHIEALRSIISRCTQAETATNFSEKEMVEISAMIDQFRRDTGLVGYR